MYINRLSERLAAISALQQKRRQYPPESFFHRIYDHAIDMAFGETREINSFLQRNLLRDAKRTLSRQVEQSPFVEPKDEDGKSLPLESLGQDPITPEHQLIFKDLLEHIQHACEELHEFAPAILDAMLEDESTRDTAKALGISESLVKKLRVQVRNLAKQIILN